MLNKRNEELISRNEAQGRLNLVDAFINNLTFALFKHETPPEITDQRADKYDHASTLEFTPNTQPVITDQVVESYDPYAEQPVEDQQTQATLDALARIEKAFEDQNS